MLSRLPTRLWQDRRGFTLIETLVAMVTGLIVSGALFAILEVSLHQSTRLSDVAQSTQLGRTAMNRVVDAMHSGCIYESFAPVQVGSTKTKLILVSGYSEETEVPTKATNATGIHKDEFELNTTNNRLIDKSYLSASEESAGKYKWEPVKEVRLGENVKQIPVTGKESEKEPVFKYYEYATSATTSATVASNTLSEIKEVKELSAEQAKKVAAVEVRFKMLPTDNNEALGRSVNLNSLVTFAFSAPDSEATIKGGPCE